MKEIHQEKQAYRTTQKHLFIADYANYLEQHTHIHKKKTFNKMFSESNKGDYLIINN